MTNKRAGQDRAPWNRRDGVAFAPASQAEVCSGPVTGPLPKKDVPMTADRIARLLEDLQRALGGLLAPEPTYEPRPIPVRVDDRPRQPRR